MPLSDVLKHAACCLSCLCHLVHQTFASTNERSRALPTVWRRWYCVHRINNLVHHIPRSQQHTTCFLGKAGCSQTFEFGHQSDVRDNLPLTDLSFNYSLRKNIQGLNPTIFLCYPYADACFFGRQCSFYFCCGQCSMKSYAVLWQCIRDITTGCPVSDGTAIRREMIGKFASGEDRPVVLHLKAVKLDQSLRVFAEDDGGGAGWVHKDGRASPMSGCAECELTCHWH